MPNKREVLLNPLYAQDKLTVAEQVASSCKCMQVFPCVDATLTQKKYLLLGIDQKMYWKVEENLEKSGKFGSHKSGNHA